MAELSPEQQMVALNGVLKVALRHPNLLQRPAFEELAGAIGAAVPFAQMAVLLPDGLGHKRLYAATRGGDTVVPFGARVPMQPAVRQRVYDEQAPYACDDTESGNEYERRTARAGYRSYVILPIRVDRAESGLSSSSPAVPRSALPAKGAARAVIAEMTFAFEEPGAARRAPLGVLQEIADIVGASFERSLSLARDPLASAPAILRDLTHAMRGGDETLPLLTRIRKLEEQLRALDSLSTLGMLAAGVAHEINNPAAFLLLGLSMLGQKLEPLGPEGTPGGLPEGAGELLRSLQESIVRIVDIVRDLRLFASPPAPEGHRAVIDVNRTVESALTLTRGPIGERAELVRDLGDVPPVVMDEGRLGQVLVNLLVNAAQAIPKSYPAQRHTVTIATRSDGRTVEIEVTDTGAGIAAEHLGRIWEPFFSTKSPDVGTGLGLSISREIVERAGGTMTVESPVPGARAGAPAAGARFRVSLPAAGAGQEE